jgi:hypothetical protein
MSTIKSEPVSEREAQMLRNLIPTLRITWGLCYSGRNCWGPDGNSPANAYGEGRNARKAGVRQTRCPPYPSAADRDAWLQGWLEAA